MLIIGHSGLPSKFPLHDEIIFPRRQIGFRVAREPHKNHDSVPANAHPGVAQANRTGQPPTEPYIDITGAPPRPIIKGPLESRLVHYSPKLTDDAVGLLAVPPHIDAPSIGSIDTCNPRMEGGAENTPLQRLQGSPHHTVPRPGFAQRSGRSLFLFIYKFAMTAPRLPSAAHAFTRTLPLSL